MVSREFREALLDVHHGEQFGVAVFETLLDHAADDAQRYVMGTLLQLEAEGTVLMRPVLSRLGLPLAVNTGREAEGRAGAEALVGLPWEEKFAAMAAGIGARGLPMYEALATLVAPDEDAEAHRLAEFMGTHERAILAAAENVAAGAENPMAPVNAILHFPLVAPAT